ncbi:3-methyl-2-oxobutanoate hydroxymethyltransferase [Hyphomonas polymorpha PS728]|uniref:3-methyl-2-oxobutanoate hydroxymethyltransferase n=1 Tax=Hyphomonas polymorpha PS728 TaxID=1280954 RepID=A0A062VPD1_9PROT|nr:3-methyl-2-oxobutanoate hydroxymethyltransferase [Hyphomonas polymorpha]KDA00603.1 3-methyl-2-oxobutanoate hydroxymethyltransferase [Hyphomonas polymorpha PS728]
MSKQTQTTRKTVKDIAAAKGATPLVMLTAYDAPTAAILDPHCDILLVGDSLGMVVHGLPSTVGVTMEMMILHGQAVMRGSQSAMVVVDMPFGSYETNADQAFLNAVRIMKETGCQAIKIESGAYAAGQIAHLVERGIPVMGHIGLRPQAIHVDGGFRAKGRTDGERDRVIAEARAAADAGAFCIVIEGVAEDLAAEISAEVSCPTIGIGASAACDGQVLVTQDMLGLFDWTPKFVRRYADLRAAIDAAAAEYAADVRARRFPGTAETYSLRKQGA